MSLLKFDDRSAFYHWIISLPDDLVVIDGDYIVFSFASADSSKVEIDDAIDRLLDEFSSFERSRDGKI